MAKKNFKLEDVPHEVMWVWVIQWNRQPVGMTTYNKIEEIIDRYPQYFAWEYQYKAIPQSIHDAFLRECYPERFEPIKWDEIKPHGKGIIAQIREQEYVKFPSTQKEFLQAIEDCQKSMNEQEEKRIAYEKRVRKIWNKHYSKFKLECRENF